MQKPNFFIIGAPKCGTTALSEYLRTHPEVYFADLKEPHYFCTDFSEKFRFIFSEEKYLNTCFADATEKHKAIGEGSVWYLYSKDAVKNILEFNPNAKIIVMIRNPVEMVYSWHSQALFSRDENVEDFETAWKLIAERRTGSHLPELCRELLFVDYEKIGKLSKQVERVKKLLPKNQFKVILFDDFKSNTAGVYKELLEFLEVSDDGKRDFEQINANKASRSVWLANALRKPPQPLVRLSQKAKKMIGIKRLGVIGTISEMNARQVQRKAMSIELKKELQEIFREDVLQLSQLINRDLSHWLVQAPSTAE